MPILGLWLVFLVSIFPELQLCIFRFLSHICTRVPWETLSSTCLIGTLQLFPNPFPQQKPLAQLRYPPLPHPQSSKPRCYFQCLLYHPHIQTITEFRWLYFQDWLHSGSLLCHLRCYCDSLFLWYASAVFPTATLLLSFPPPCGCPTHSPNAQL